MNFMGLLTKLPEWTKLITYASVLKSLCKKDYLERRQLDSTAINFFDTLTLDYNNQLIDNAVIDALIALAHACQVPQLIQAQMQGEYVNSAENRPALHTALRSFDESPLYVDGHNIMPDIFAAREQMRCISEQLRQGLWLGFSERAITDVVNLGIGGSHLGPQCTLQALNQYVNTDLKFHFISNSDPYEFKCLLDSLCPETTLFIVSSKSFNTQETLSHMQTALTWINQPQYIDRHFIAVTANVEKAQRLGFIHIIPIWDWVGGRFSVCSAINLITCIAIGFEAFCDFLQGAYLMDQHVLSTDLKNNLPVMLAVLGIWNNNFLDVHQLLLLTYAQNLQYFASYVQQLDMESNGKSIDKNGVMVQYATGPIVWGGLGNQAQHSYYQLLCQGTHKITADLISIETDRDDLIYHMCLAHAELLAYGDGVVNNQSSVNHIRLKDRSPRTLGALIAAYEHKIYIQGVIWNINSFDQPGVESAKRLMNQSLLKEREAEVLV